MAIVCGKESKVYVDCGAGLVQVKCAQSYDVQKTRSKKEIACLGEEQKRSFPGQQDITISLSVYCDPMDPGQQCLIDGEIMDLYIRPAGDGAGLPEHAGTVSLDDCNFSVGSGDDIVIYSYTFTPADDAFIWSNGLQ